MNPGQLQLTGILLAAGKGRRFDPTGKQNKLTQSLPNGECVAVATARRLLAVLPVVVAVVRPDDAYLAAQLREVGCVVTSFPDAEQGMGASLAFAMTHASAADGWIIALADMPYVQAVTVQRLADALHDGADIVVPVYHGQRGNPVGFCRRYLAALLAMQGDQGARHLLAMQPVCEVPVEDAGVLQDIDTVADLQARV